MGDIAVITVIGMDGSPLAAQARAALAGATLIVGAARHLETVVGGTGPDGAGEGGARRKGGVGRDRAVQDGAGRDGEPATVVLGPLAPALTALREHDGNAVVLASGDPGFFGVVRVLREYGLEPDVLPAVSSVALAFARAGLAWDDATVVSAHGRDPRPAVNVCRAHRKVAVLTGPGAGPAEIGAALDGWPRRLIVCENLGGDGERVTECSSSSAARRTWADPNVVVVLSTANQPARDSAGWCWAAGGGRSGAWGGRAGWALAEDDFDHRDAVITKAEVRAVALARLAPGPGLLIWDVGAGSGSVAVECARFGAAVVAVERDPLRCARIRSNAERHDVTVRVVRGEAPAALDGLPDPDAVFTGGGGPGVVAAVAERRPPRIVVALAAIERVGPARDTLAKAGYTVGGALVQASRLTSLPGGLHHLTPVNPVFLLSAVAPADEKAGAPPGAAPQGPGAL